MSKIIDFNKEREAKIPGGPYCDGCPYHKYLGTDYLLRDMDMLKKVRFSLPSKDDRWVVCPSKDNCTSSCIKDGEPTCHCQRVRCDYLNLQDDEEDTLLWDKVKACGINDD